MKRTRLSTLSRNSQVFHRLAHDGLYGFYRRCWFALKYALYCYYWLFDLLLLLPLLLLLCSSFLFSDGLIKIHFVPLLATKHVAHSWLSK